ncbi:MAG: TIGR01244 family sulfur transferase [Halioglobus sp.]
MKIVKLTDTLAVSAQILPEDVAAIAAAGYQVLINNRPDGEEGTQPAAADIAAAARAVGLEYHHLPVTATSFPGPDFDALSDLLDDPVRPVLAFCRSGTRCANLWVASVDEAEREQAMAVAQQRGYDLVMALRFLGQ